MVLTTANCELIICYSSIIRVDAIWINRLSGYRLFVICVNKSFIFIHASRNTSHLYSFGLLVYINYISFEISGPFVPHLAANNWSSLFYSSPFHCTGFCCACSCSCLGIFVFFFKFDYLLPYVKITQVLRLLFSSFWFCTFCKVLFMHISYVSGVVIFYEILIGHTDFVFSF